jgi:hypothetical protein
VVCAGGAVKGLVDPQKSHFEATKPRSRASSPAEKENAPYKNQVSTAGIDYNDVHTPSLRARIAVNTDTVLSPSGILNTI